MTEEEFEQLKNSIRAKLGNAIHADQPNEKELAEHRKVDRDLDRLERILKRIVSSDPAARQRRREENDRWRKFKQERKQWFAERREFGTRLDDKLKALAEDIQTRRNNCES